MGTGRPQVKIAAATLAGGDKNQDRYAYGDGWAFVLDGASSFATTQPEHHGGWYAERLKNALVNELTASSNYGTTHIVGRAIAEAASAHDDPETCPTSTVAMARWTDEEVEAYVLGDSTIALIGDGDATVLTDTRLADIAPSLREEYRSRLAEGRGFDERHRELLQQLQSAQATTRNRAGGYWIAGADPSAAHRGVLRTRRRETVRAVVLATDGATAGFNYGSLSRWTSVAALDPKVAIQRVIRDEANDPNAARWPRSKSHDDKTLLTIALSSGP